MSTQPGEEFVELEVEILDAVVVGEAPGVAVARRGPAGAGLAQAAAVAATGFVAGAATAAVVGHQLAKRVGRSRAGLPRRATQSERGIDLLEVVASRSFVVDVHLLGRRTD